MEQEVTKYLLTASVFASRPTAGMAYCRRATECISHNLHYREFGEYPEPDEKGSYPSLSGILNKVKYGLERQTSEVLFSINAQSRGSLHWDFKSRGRSAKKRHVEAVIHQIANTFQDLYGKELVLSGMKLDDDTLEYTVKKTLEKELTEAGLSKEDKPGEDEVDKEELDIILDIAESATEKGIEFDYGEENRLGNAAELAGKWDLAKGYYKQALRGYKKLGDRKGEAISLNNLGYVDELKGSIEEAEGLYRGSMAISKDIGYRLGECSSLNLLGNVAEAKGRLEEAERLYRGSMAIAKDIGNRRREAVVNNNLGVIASQKGSIEEAEEFFTECNAISREIGDRRLEALTLDALGEIALGRGRIEEAERLYKESLVIDKELGDRRGEADSLSYLGFVAMQRDDLEEAGRLLEEALAIDQEIGDPLGEITSLFDLGAVALQRGDLEEAERLYRESVRISNDMKVPLDPWLVDKGYTDPDTRWDFPPRKDDSRSSE